VQYTNLAAEGTPCGDDAGRDGCAGEEVDENPRHSRRFDAIVLRLQGSCVPRTKRGV